MILILFLFIQLIQSNQIEYEIEETTLIIKGKGEIPNYTINEIPWKNQKEIITKIKINEEIISIGNFAFYNFENVKEIELPK